MSKKGGGGGGGPLVYPPPYMCIYTVFICVPERVKYNFVSHTILNTTSSESIFSRFLDGRRGSVVSRIIAC